ncbi:hypothetical protein SESBI_16968 [Sesbania bispinosa]|nr:hypothetical protein SESBI_16968 [Sesbania bispinosa]
MPVVLDISSDEEEGLMEEPKISDFDWIKDLLFTSDEESDDEGDPENGVTSVDEEATGSDELLVVGEKGQIACRDYPHARHLCAKFPFSSTPHERHCSQCHCFVCDSLAPCLKWGTGILSSDHCHANDKTELWKIQRKNFKLCQSSPLPASTNYGTSLHVVHPQNNEILPCDSIHLSPNSVLQNQVSISTAIRTCSSLNSISQNQASQTTVTHALSSSLNSSVQNQISRPINIPACPPASNLTIPNGTNHGRCQESGSTLLRNRYRPRSVPRQLLGVRSHAIQRERGSGASSLGPQFLHPHMMSKGVGSAGGIRTMNRSSNGSPGFNNCVNATRQCDKFHTATGFSNFRNHNGPDDVCHPINSSLFSHSSSGPAILSCVNQQTVTSETHAYGHSLSQSNDSQDFHQTSIQDNDAPSSYVACLDNNQHQVRSQNNNADGNVTQSGVTSKDTCQPKPHEESPSGTAGKFSVFDSSWAENTSQGIEPAIECSPLQSPGTINQPPNIEKSGTQFTGSTEPVIECSQSPSSLLDIENWLFDKDSIPMVTDGVLSRELNIPSPDLTPVDSGMLLFYLNGGE